MGRKRPWYADGVRFGCAGSANCCSSHGEYDRVYFTRDEERALGEFLGLSRTQLRRRYLKLEDGYRVARSNGAACIFLEGTRCSVYPVRPVPCRTWPFWPEMMKPEVWKTEVLAFCPGTRRGRARTRREIEAAMRLKRAHDRALENER